ncbi:DUF4248 domain-containing protein [Bacteroides sp. 519]|uniref:DUF4248 domain-containing protein n=1 Tax=Bacteroides sp. 519 TaxID=2302937 RepID=UPI0013D174A3|nr:DUF4248 domain-containing protein [Bacteroides sp. 519]NDV58944.1 DUF4248 domain-containing protein [Bacteroides sp. 519]
MESIQQEVFVANYMLGIRSFTRSELAMMYMPNLSKATALKNFNNWIKLNKKLQADLLLAGASENTRRYTPKQVKVIFEAFDAPYVTDNKAV